MEAANAKRELAPCSPAQVSDKPLKCAALSPPPPLQDLIDGVDMMRRPWLQGIALVHRVQAQIAGWPSRIGLASSPIETTVGRVLT